MGLVISNVKRIIDEKGYKKSAIAGRMGITPQAMSDLLAGRRIIRADLVPTLSRALEVEPNELFRSQ